MNSNKKLALLGGGVVAAAVVAFLAFGVFGIQSAFIDDRVDEADPFAAPSGLASDDMTAELAAEMEEATDPATEVSMDEPVPEMMVEDTASGSSAPVVERVVEGSFIDRSHVGAGTAVVLSDGNQRFLRFEDDFAVDNGPDLNVYLVRGVDADGDAGQFDDDFIDLGDMKGNIGAQNYELGADVDLDEYDTVVIWCVRFGVAFNAADLA